MISITLYSRKDCHLCDEAVSLLDSLQEEYPHELSVVDVDSSRELKQKFGESVPVIVAGPYTIKAPISPLDLRITLGAVQRGIEQEQEITAQISRRIPNEFLKWTRSDSIFYWLSRHYLALLNLFIFIYVGLPFLAPVLMKAGAEAPAEIIYRVYGFACHQMGFRSWFLFGEQAAYPRAEAGIDGLISWEQATGFHRDDVLSARGFLGNELLGYKIALCERDVAIYAAILGFGLLFALVKRRIPALPWYLWLLLALVPIGLDGLSQYISQPPFNFIPYRESSPMLRAMTGAMFGIFTAWFGYPYMEAAQQDTLKTMQDKLDQIRLTRTA